MKHKLILIILSLSLISCFFLFNAQASLPTHDSQNQPLPSLAPMLEKIIPAVVNISTRGSYAGSNDLHDMLDDSFLRRFFNFDNHKQVEPEQHARTLGSGVIVDADKGYILTNNHVIEDAKTITVTLREGSELKAELVGSDPQTDIALLKVPAENLTAIKMSDSDKLRVGDFTLAIGHPFGLEQTVTSGIVSGLGRSGLGIEGYEDFIQTDASINPGNSGGALVNLRGELVGINTAIFSRSGGNIGIGFAIPVNMAKSVMDQLIQHGSIQRGVLGVQIQDLTPELASAFDVKVRHGAVIAQVLPDTAASKAGLKAGDIIIQVDTHKIDDASDLRNYIGLNRPGKKVKIKVIRGAKEMDIKATIGGQAGYTSLSGKTGFDGKHLHKSLAGALLGKNTQGSSGIEILEIQTGSEAAGNGLRSGDVIVSINRYPVNSVDDLKQISKRRFQAVALNIYRDNTALFIVLR